MAAKKFDGLIEAVRYTADGKIDVVRAYERRGATYSDRILIDRAALITRLKNGEKFVTGTRKELWASTFEIQKEVQLIKSTNGEVIATRPASDNDQLESTPLF